MKSVLTVNITEEQIYKEFLRLGMEQLIAKDLSKRYYHNELTYRDLENLEKQFNLKFDNLISEISFVEKNLNTKIDNLDAKIDTVEKNLQKDISNLEQNLNKNMSILEQNLNKNMSILEQNLKKELQVNSQIFLEKLKVSNRVISIIVVVVVPAAISILTPFVMSLISNYYK
ncbi:Bdr family repetitive protein [Borreliella afzelii]|uniref:Bdr family protein n=1 Tax=Borreliella afzelii TaxID=29518 RepID=A0A1L4DGH1_BORAF|nr:Bdr family protein [Borreliella afzelii]